MIKKPIVTTVGSSILDTFFYTEEGTVIENKKDVMCCEYLAFEKAAKISASSVYTTYGGGAANSAMTFSRLGKQTQIITAIGSDAIGIEMIKNLQKNNIITRMVQTPLNSSTAMSFIPTLSNSGDHVVFVSRGASQQLHITESISKKIITPFIYVTSLSGPWKQSLSNIFSRSEKKNIKVHWNPGSKQLSAPYSAIRKFIKGTWVLQLNRDEAIELCVRAGIKTNMSNISTRSLVKHIQALGPEVALVTDGHKGAYVHDGKKAYYQKAKKVRVVNKTGAGDAFGSGFAVGMMSKAGIQKSLKLGSENSASVVRGMGAQVGILSKKKALSIIK